MSEIEILEEPHEFATLKDEESNIFTNDGYNTEYIDGEFVDYDLIDVDSDTFIEQKLSWKILFIIKGHHIKHKRTRSTTNVGGSDGLRGRTYSFHSETEILRPFSNTKQKSPKKRDDSKIENNKCSCMDKYVVDVDSKKRTLWDIIVVLLLIYTIFYLPFDIAFFDNNNNDWLDYIVDILFFIDIIISFFTPYQKIDNSYEKRFGYIAKNYIYKWFILDIVAIFPFYLFVSSSLDRLFFVTKIPRLIKVIRVVRLVKLLRIYKLKNIFEKMKYSPKVHDGFIRILRLISIIILFSHFSACIFFFIGDFISDLYDVPSWITNEESVHNGLINESIFHQYIASLYYSISTIAAVGFGDIRSTNMPEMLYSLSLVFFGAVVFSYITATISSILHDFDTKSAIYRAKMSNLIIFVKQLGLTHNLSRKLFIEMSNKWKYELNDKKNDIDYGVKDELPKQLLYEVSIEMHKELIDSSSFFMIFEHDTDEYPFLNELISNMQSRKAYEGEFIANVGNICDYWGIIQSGKMVGVSSLDNSLELMLWNNGDSFGEIPIFLTENWCWNMRCTKDAIYYSINKTKFLSLLSHASTISKKLVKLAGKRLQKIVKMKNRKKELLNYQSNKHKKNNALHFRLKQLASFWQSLSNNTERDVTKQPWFDTDKINSFKNDNINLLRNSTPKQKWEYLRKFIDVFVLNYQKNSNDNRGSIINTEILKVQYALNEIEKDYKIWKRGSELPNLYT